MKKLLILAAALSAAQLQAQVILQDDFTYSDGVTMTVSGGKWARHSGTADNSFVAGGKLEVFATRGDDINSAFTGAPSTTVYASFLVKCTSLPSAGGAYFAHFKDNGTSNFRGRTWALAPAGTAPGGWRLGITAAGNSPISVYPLDLATNVDYRVTISYDTVNFLGTLWVDPVVETDQNVQTTDSTAALTLSTFAFRQASGQGSLTVDDFYVANTFAEANVGTPKPATVYYQPPTALTVDEFGSTNLLCVAGGAGTVTFQWQKDNVDLFDDGIVSGATSNRLSLTGVAVANAGAYRCIITSTTNSVVSGSVTSSVTTVTVNTTPVPPFITSQPVSRTNTIGSVESFTVGAGGSTPLAYQWYHVDLVNVVTNPVGSGEATISLGPIDSTVEGQYFAQISNSYGTTNSSLVNLVVTPPIVTNIAYLRTRQDANWLPNDTNTTYQAEGIVTVRTNTTGLVNTQIYMQDDTGGIVVFVAGLSGIGQPLPGDKVRVVGRLGSFNSLFEFNNSALNPYHTLTVLSSDNPMPASKPFTFSLTNNLPAIEALEGSLITITNVYFPTGGTGAFFPRGSTVVMTNAAGEGFPLFVNSTALVETNMPIPAFAYEVTGVLSQFLSQTEPDRTRGYQIIPTSYAYIVTNLPPTPDLAINRTGNVTTLGWTNLDGSTYSIHAATDVAGPYSRVAFGLNFLTNTTGSFVETNSGAVRFYRASSP
jgi:hypothetical protein